MLVIIDAGSAARFNKRVGIAVMTYALVCGTQIFCRFLAVSELFYIFHGKIFGLVDAHSFTYVPW